MAEPRSSWKRIVVLGLWVGLLLAASRIVVLYGMDQVVRGHPWDTVVLRLSERAVRTTALGLLTGVLAVGVLGRLGFLRGLLPAALLIFVLLSGYGWDDHFHVPDVRSQSGQKALAGLGAAALVAGAALLPLVRRAPAVLADRAGTLVVLLLALGLPLGLHAATRGSDELVLRSIQVELTQSPERMRVLRSHPEAAPHVAVMTPAFGYQFDSADLPAFVMPPPAAVEFTVDPGPGTLAFVGAAGIDREIRREVRPKQLPITVHFRVLRNGDAAFDESVVYTDHAEAAVRSWRRFRIPVEAGDVLRLETEVDTPNLDDARPLSVGFGLCRIERSDRRPGARSSPQAPNIVLIVVDTLRVDRMSLYGYEKRTTPRLEELAARGTVFEQALAASSWTWPSTASILTGRLPSEHGVLDQRSCYLDSSIETLAEVLQLRGYKTAGFVGNPLIVADKNFDQGFEHFFATRGHFLFSDVLVPDVLQWLERHAKTRFFLYAHIVDPHVPYSPLPEHVERFTSGRPADLPEHPMTTYSSMARAAQARGEAVEDVVPAEHLRWMNEVYDASVATADTWVGRILDHLDDLGIAGETIVAITSDHGEGLGEHDMFNHGGNLHAEVVRAPLVLAGAGIGAGVRVTNPVSNRHLAPTLARFGGAVIDGLEDPLDLVADGASGMRPVFFSTDVGWRGEKNFQTLLGVRSEGRVLHAHFEDPTWTVLGVYDPLEDPQELRNLHDADPTWAETLVRDVVELRRARSALAPRAKAAGAGTSRMLEALGYTGGEPEPEPASRDED